jgi:hypothetical protein
MKLPQFIVDASLDGAGPFGGAGVLAHEPASPVVPAASVKGTHCIPDPECSTGFSKMFCSSHDPDSCVETGICCTPASPPPPPSCPAGREPCSDGGLFGCCVPGTHCCNDNHGCCPDGQTCRSIFGHPFCDPIFVTGSVGGVRPPLATMRAGAGGRRVSARSFG